MLAGGSIITVDTFRQVFVFDCNRLVIKLVRLIRSKLVLVFASCPYNVELTVLNGDFRHITDKQVKEM